MKKVKNCYFFILLPVDDGSDSNKFEMNISVLIPNSYYPS